MYSTPYNTGADPSQTLVVKMAVFTHVNTGSYIS